MAASALARNLERRPVFALKPIRSAEFDCLSNHLPHAANASSRRRTIASTKVRPWLGVVRDPAFPDAP